MTLQQMDRNGDRAISGSGHDHRMQITVQDNDFNALNTKYEELKAMKM